MKRIIKISGATGSGKSHLLQMIVGSVSASGCVVVDGQSTLQGILQLVRGRENVTLLIDECDHELLAELESITEHSAVWGRIGCVYAVLREPVNDEALTHVAPLLLAAIKRLIDPKDLDLSGQSKQALDAIKAAGGDV